MDKLLLGLYCATAAACSVAALPFQKKRDVKQATANFMVALPAAWAAGSSLGEMGPSVGGVSVLATTAGAALAIAGLEAINRKFEGDRPAAVRR